jgi:hypothetical protein
MTTRRLVTAAALACLLLAHTAIAKSVECKYNPSGILHSDACLLSSQPPLPGEIGDLVESIMAQIEALSLGAIPLGGLRCHEDDISGAQSKKFDIADDVNPICYTLLYEFDLTLPEVHVNFRLLFRGTWARTDAPEELEYKTCKDMCNYFKRATTIDIHMVHARPLYLGCWHDENRNNENAGEVARTGIDCSQYCGNGKPGPCEDEGSGGSAAPWIVFGVLMAALVVLVALGAAFWWFKLRTP